MQRKKTQSEKQKNRQTDTKQIWTDTIDVQNKLGKTEGTRTMNEITFDIGRRHNEKGFLTIIPDFIYK